MREGKSDDLVIVCKSERQAKAASEAVAAWVAQAGLTLHPDKTRVVDCRAGPFEFLGYRLERGRRFPRGKSVGELRDSIRQKTRRTDGRALSVVIADVNATLRGWFGHFKHAHRASFPAPDAWVRGRLRSLLRKRQKRKGRARGLDHQRWPNANFAGQGLYSPTEAFARACQAVKAAHRPESRMR